MFTYININNRNRFVDFAERFDESLYEVGETYEDYLAGKWVMLNEEQAQYHNEHPNANVKTVWNLGVVEQPETPTHVRTLEEAKNERIWACEEYDRSENVNQFFLNGSGMWFEAQERTGYKDSIAAARLLGEDSVEMFLGNTLVAIPCDMAEIMLARIQRYADRCFNVTKQHKINIAALETIEEVDDYDFTVGYPEKLEFNL